MNPDFQLIHSDGLIVGFRAGRDEQFKLIALCRRFDGSVIFREGEVMVVEVSGYRELIDEMLAKLPCDGVTHLWRSGAPVATKTRAFSRDLLSQIRGDDMTGSSVPVLYP